MTGQMVVYVTSTEVVVYAWPVGPGTVVTPPQFPKHSVTVNVEVVKAVITFVVPLSYTVEVIGQVVTVVLLRFIVS